MTQGKMYEYIVGSRGASQLGGYLLGNPLGYKANKLWFHQVTQLVY